MGKPDNTENGLLGHDPKGWGHLDTHLCYEPLIWPTKPHDSRLAARPNDRQRRSRAMAGHGLDPYIVHPQAVMEIVSSVPHSEAMLAAAWLHDTVEDTPTTLGDIASHFGPQVAELVGMLTNVSGTGGGNRFERKNRDRRHSAGASPQAKTIKLADLIDNTRSLLEYDSHFARTYLIEKQRLLEVLTEGDPTLWRQASHIVEQGLTRLQLPPHNVPASWFEHARQRYRESDAA